ncbi:uncharacterized protein PG998_012554 [Apiospora kogelbergensis]|uniref:Uncharacterized protein n=1 Tax=Apiospora kogelbergensis TaxID=1337665 RepID=A0AAW0QQI6_9PEZI
MAEVQYAPGRMERLSVDDFETASIRSAAPSYLSDAPSYSTLPPAESVPAYTPATAPPYTPTPSASTNAGERGRGRDTATNNNAWPRTIGLPRVPSPFRRGQDPTLGQYLRIGTNPWSSLHSNPTARHYQAVANRRVASAPGNSNNSNANSNAEAVRTVRDTMARLNEQEEQRAAARLRPLEDPHLVGEEAAARARRARLARENGDEILIREDRRWDWFLASLSEMEQRSQGLKDFENRQRRRATGGRRFGRF